MHRGCDASALKLLSVVAVRRGRNRRQTGAVQRCVEPIPAAIAGEHAPRAIRPVRARCKADDPHAWAITAEAGHWPAPVFVIAVSRALFACNMTAPLDQARALPAIDDRFI